MKDEFRIHTPKTHGARKFFVFLFLGLIGLFVLLFFWKFFHTLWVIKYGSTEAKQALHEKINPSFTLSPETLFTRRAKVSKVEAAELIHPTSPRTGSPKAPVRIVAFMDFECPYSQKSYPFLKTLQEEYGDVVQIVYKHFPVGAIHPNALPAAVAASCAQEQGKFFEYSDILFTTKALDTSSLLNAAQTVGLDIASFQNCIASEKYIDEIRQDMQEGADIAVRGTPTFVVENKIIEGVVDKQLWERAILNALQKK